MSKCFISFYFKSPSTNVIVFCGSIIKLYYVSISEEKFIKYSCLPGITFMDMYLVYPSVINKCK